MQVSEPSSDAGSDIPDNLPDWGEANATCMIIGSDPTVWQTWSDANNANYVDSVLTPDNTGLGLGETARSVGMQELTDPEVDTDHVIRITARILNDPTDGGYIVLVRIFGGAYDPDHGPPDLQFNLLTDFSPSIVGAAFVESTYLMSSDDVDTFRAAGCYAGFWVNILAQNQSFPSPPNTVDVSFVQFTCPGGSGPTVITIEGEGGVAVGNNPAAPNSWRQTQATASGGVKIGTPPGHHGILVGQSIVGSGGLRIGTARANNAGTLNGLTGDAAGAAGGHRPGTPCTGIRGAQRTGI